MTKEDFASIPFQPLRDNLLVKMMDKEETSKGGIVLPDKAQENQYKGIVLKTGPGKSTDEGGIRPMHVKVGDAVVFQTYRGNHNGTQIDIDGVKYIVIPENEILGVVR